MSENKSITKSYTIIALGGSVLVPHDINTTLLIHLKAILKKIVKTRHTRFIIVVGGGSISRTYQAAAKKLYPHISRSRLDEIGIAATYLNASLVKNVLGKTTAATIINSAKKLSRSTSPITIVSGWTPGCSTDAVAIRTAKKLHVKQVILVGRPDYVYDKDFVKFKHAKHFSHISWAAYRKLIPSKWFPGLPSPVDPVAAYEAQNANINAIVISGSDVKNLERVLRGKQFKGTVISNKK